MSGTHRPTPLGRQIRAISLAFLLVILAAALPTAASAQVGYDTFDTQTVNDRMGSGDEVPYTGAATLVSSTPGFNTSAYTLEEDEGAVDSRNRTGCARPGGGDFFFGGKSAWVRFLPGVAGRVTFEALTDYDVIVWAYQAPDARRGVYRPDQLTNLDCNNSRVQGAAAPNSESLTQLRATPGRALHFQSAGSCGTGTSPAAGCPNQNVAQGGQTTFRVTFVPDNADQDAVPDTLDACPTEKGTAADGCPDADGDGISDRGDACPGVRGTEANGCPPPDTDGDGFLDVSDDCPQVPGVAPRGCPLSDADGDGIPDVSDRCQQQRGGVATQGCPDRDGDGVIDREDSCPAAAGRLATKGCPDADGDRVADKDDRCPRVRGTVPSRGCPPRLAASVRDRWSAGSRDTFALILRVTTPKRSRIVASCKSRGEGCPRTQVIRSTTATTTSLKRYLGRKLRPGAVVTIIVTRPGAHGTRVRFVVRGTGGPRRTEACLPAAGLKSCSA